MGSRGRRWSVTSGGLRADLSAINSPTITRLPSSWPNSPENQDSVFEYNRQISSEPRAKNRSNSIGEFFGASRIRNNSSSEESPRFKTPRFSLSMFQGNSKNNQKAGLSIVTLSNGNTILVYSEHGCELNNSVSKAKTDLKLRSYCFISASVQTVQLLDSPRGVIGSTLERIIEQSFDKEETNDEEAKKDIFYDFLRNEHVYRQSLENLHYIYAEPFRCFPYLTPEEHEQIFYGIELLISLSSALISQLRSTLSNWDPNNSYIGIIFPPEIWTHYNEYYCRYSQIKKIFEQKLQEECLFAEFCQENKICSGQSLEDLLFMPCQRIPEYEQYLSSLLERTEENQPEYQNLKKAIAKIKQILHGCYEEPNGTRQTENNKNNFSHNTTQLNKDKISENVIKRRKSSYGAVLFKKVKSSRISGDRNFDLDFLNFSRYQSNVKRLYIMESAVQLTHSIQTQDRYLFLFDDLLLVAKQKSNTQFKLKYCVRICEIWLATCLDEISEVSYDEEKSFVIGWPTINKVATFPSKDMKEKWQTALKQLINEKKENEKPKEIQLNIQNTDQKPIITMFVQNTATVKDVVKKYLEQFLIPKGDIADYVLCSEYGDNDSTPYPLIGHEIPYNIKMNDIRNNSENNDCDNTEAKKKYDFLMSKKATKKHNAEDIDGKGLKKKQHHFNLFKRSPKLEEKSLGKLFGQPLKNVSIDDNPPKPIEYLLRLLFKQGPSTRGIFRKPGNAKKKRELCEMLDHEETINMADVTGNLAAAVLMEYLRNIPQGLLMDDKYTEWIEAGKLLNETEKLTKIQSLVRDLFPCNQQLLQQLMCVLYHINKKSSENLMSSQNLAMCIAPSLLGSKQPDCQDDLISITDVISHMIENSVQIFGEEVISLFGEMPSERLHEDSDTDSFHSTLSTQESGGLQQSDDSSMHSLEREFGNAELENSTSCLSATIKRTSDHHHDTDSITNGLQNFKEEQISAYEIISPQKNDSQDSEDSISSLASNDSAFPVPPPRRNRKNAQDGKYKSMTSIDKANQNSISKNNSSSQSVNDLLAFTTDSSNHHQSLSDYPHEKLKSVHSSKNSFKSQIIMTEPQVPKHPARNSQQESVEWISFTKNLSSNPQHPEHEESLERNQRRNDKKCLSRIPQSKSVDNLPDHLWQQSKHMQLQQQYNIESVHPERIHLLPAPQDSSSLTNKPNSQNNTQVCHSERKHLPLALQNSCSSINKLEQEHDIQTLPHKSIKLLLAPQNSCPLGNKSENLDENKLELALFKIRSDSSSKGNSSEVTPQKMNEKFLRIDLNLSHPPNVLLQKIGQSVAVSEQSNKRNTSNTACKDSAKFNKETGMYFSNGKELAISGRAQSNHTVYSENNQPTIKVLNLDKNGNITSPLYPAASAGIYQKPKHPPPYEEAIKQKQHKIGKSVENLHQESLNFQNPAIDKKHMKAPQAEKLTSPHTKVNWKHTANSRSPQKLVQNQYKEVYEKSRKKSMSPNDIGSMSRLQKSYSKSDSQLNFLCNDVTESVRKYPVVDCYPQIRNESYIGSSDDDCNKHRNLKKIEVKSDKPEKKYRNATNQNNVLHRSLSKSKSVDYTTDQDIERTVDSYGKSKQSVLPWNVSEMINRFSMFNNELPH